MASRACFFSSLLGLYRLRWQVRVSDEGECTIRVFLRNAIGVRYLDM
jgi:hypothetical protein